jgi:hypothetical protein
MFTMADSIFQVEIFVAVVLLLFFIVNLRTVLDILANLIE